MGNMCDDLVRFADGQLEMTAAQEFRDHLPSCERCQADLVDAMQLLAHLSSLRPTRRQFSSSQRRGVILLGVILLISALVRVLSTY
jgi:anti-sigma factor RsiW